MRHVYRVLATTLAVLAIVVGGCGPGVYDAKGVPVLIPTCTGDTPLYCASTNSCFAEDAAHCGPACNECQAIPNANVFCDTNNIDPSQHTCSFTCQPGFVFDGVGACVCAAGTNACNGATTCSAETVTSCGPGCNVCPSPPHSIPSCSNGQCGFTCDIANGFVPDNAGGCACPTGTNVCGAATTCARETTAACGPNCVDCAKTTPVGATPTCTAGKCSFACDSASGFVPDGAGGCTCAVGSNSCGHPATCAADTVSVCGASCAPCPAPPGTIPSCTASQCGSACDTGNGFVSTPGGCACAPGANSCGHPTTCAADTTAVCGPNCLVCNTPPPHASAVCSSGACDFQCDPTFLRQGLGCVCPANTNVCGAETTCNAESPLRCGANCTRCPVPAGAIATCTTGACGFTCDAANGFVSDGAGGCVCAAGTNTCGHPGTCAAETANACGPNCTICPGPTNGNGAAACSPLTHSCGVTCNAGYEPDATGTKCVCAAGTVACGATVPPPGLGLACVAESTTACGPTCTTCTTAVANATPTCNVATHTCDFKCNAGFDPVGNSCRCAAGTCLPPGGATACVAETPTSCGVGACTDCSTQIPPLAAAKGATALCTSHACDYACAGAQVKCADPITGAPSCCDPACNPNGNPPTVFCGVGGAPATCVTESAQACGTACAVCTAPVNAAPVCDPAIHTCDFACNAGFFKHNGGCVRVATSSTALPPPAPPTSTFGQATIALGGKHSCAILEDGGVVCWGANDQGQLGVGARVPTGAGALSSHPVDVVLPGIAVAIAAGDAHTCAALNDGTVYCWGSNATQQLGTPQSLAFSPSPVQVAGLTSVAGFGTILAAGAGHTCAIAAGAVKCWGDNALGQLGTGAAGAATSTPTPTLVTTGATAIAAGANHACAILQGGAVRCWGANESGQLGNGTTSPSVATPGPLVPPLDGHKDPAGNSVGTGALAIAAGRQHTCVASSGAGVVCWGQDFNLQLGVRVAAVPGVPYVADRISGKASTLVSAGGAHSCGSIPTDLAPKCAGDAGTGQQPAAGTTGTCPVDLATPAGLAMVELFSGASHNCAIVGPGAVAPFSLYCWGVNDAGQLGNGATLATTTAVLQIVIGQ
ncbi:MAG TPA: hypothetical protein VFP65_30350 [Anaeromyxobacteraceae bacterium]|nr:hypothetical protein [Anaeromyxobacteraceae bacterium]